MYKDMTALLQEKELNGFKVSHFDIKLPDDYRAVYREGIPPGHYVRLNQKGEGCLMSNTPMEQYTNMKFVNSAKGDILIGGFGIGLIIMAIQDKPEVKSITVIEKSPEIIEIIGGQLPLNEKVKIIEGDVFTYTPDRKFDIIYMDIWPWVNSDIYNEQMVPLKERYQPFMKDKKRKVTCWVEKEAANDEPFWPK